MAHYLVQGNYSTASAKGMLDAPSDRDEAARTSIESVGGKLHHWYFAFGDSDFVFICEFPDDTAAMAVSMLVAASGGLSGYKTTRLMTAADGRKAMVLAKEQASAYSPPAHS